MTFKNIIRDEIRGNLPTYKEYFLATAFSVLVVFMMLMVIFNPAFMLNSLATSFVMAAKVVLVIISIFLIIFIYYSQYTFIKHRSKDYAMLTILGMNHKQLHLINMCESAVVYFAGFIVGVLASLLLEKLIFMGFAKLLDIPEIGMYMPTKAFVLTFVLFAILFIVMQIVTLNMLRRLNVKKYLEFGKKTQKVKKICVPVAILSVLVILFAYYLALTVNDNNIIQRIIPVTLMVIVGLYFFYSEFCPWILRRLDKHKSFYFKGVNMIWVSDMKYRVRDFTLILYLITITMSVGLTGFAAVFNVVTSELSQALMPVENTRFPVSVLKVISPEDSIGVACGDTLYALPKVEKLLADENIDYTEAKIGMSVMWSNRKALIRESDLPYFFDENNLPILTADKDTMRIKNNDYKMSVHIPFRAVFAVKDSLFADYSEGYSPASLTLFAMKEPIGFGKKMVDIQDSIDMQKSGEMIYSSNMVMYYYFIIRRIYLLLSFYFIIVFYICSGCMIYFKFYNNASEEGVKYLNFTKMGLSRNEIKKSVTVQIATLFFLPMIISIINVTMAMFALKSDGAPSVYMLNTLYIILFTIAIQLVYYILIRFRYLQKILPSPSDE